MSAIDTYIEEIEKLCQKNGYTGIDEAYAVLIEGKTKEKI